MADPRSFDWRGLRPASLGSSLPARSRRRTRPDAAVAGHGRPRGLPRSSLARTLFPPPGGRKRLTGRLKGLAGPFDALVGRDLSVALDHRCGSGCDARRLSTRSRARSPMKGPAPCDPRFPAAGRGAIRPASRAKGVTRPTRANRALMGGCCARDPRLYGCGMGTQLSRYAEVGSPFRPLGIILTGTPPRRLLGRLWRLVWPGFLRRLVRAMMRRRVRRGAARSLHVRRRGRNGRRRRVEWWGYPPGALHATGQCAKSPFLERRPSGARRDTGWHATRACFFRPKACQYAPSWE